jgi:hypothetical protein
MNTFNLACDRRYHLQQTAHIITRRQTHLPSPFEVEKACLFDVQVAGHVDQVIVWHRSYL